MRPALLVVVSVCGTGCSSVLGIEDLKNPPCFRDDFATGTLDPATWDIFVNGTTPAQLAVEPGALIITAPPNLQSDIGIKKVAPLDLVDGALEVEVRISGVPGGLETLVVLEEIASPGAGWAFVTVGTGLIARRFFAGNNFDDTVSIDPSQRFWRFTHDSSAQSVEFSVSADQNEYFPISTLTGQRLPVGLELRLQAGVFNNATPDPGQVTFEGLTTSGATCD